MQAPPFPLEVLGGGLTIDSAGTPVVEVRARNNGEATFDKWRLEARTYRDFAPIKEWGYGDEVKMLVDDDDLLGGDEATAQWSLYGYDGANTVRIEIHEVFVLDEGGGSTDECVDGVHECAFVFCLSSETTCPGPGDLPF